MKQDIPGIVVWGDSIGKGVVWSEEHGRYRLSARGCVRMLSSRALCPVRNHSVMGQTAEGCLKSFDSSCLYERLMSVIILTETEI